MNLLVANRNKRETRVTRSLSGNARAIRTTGNRHLGQVRTGTILAWIYLAAVATPTVSEAQNANIPDENLRAAIEDALGLPGGTVSRTPLAPADIGKLAHDHSF